MIKSGATCKWCKYIIKKETDPGYCDRDACIHDRVTWLETHPNLERRTIVTEDQLEVPAKVCSRCKKLRPVMEFNLSSRATDGRHSYCRFCQHDLNSLRSQGVLGKVELKSVTKKELKGPEPVVIRRRGPSKSKTSTFGRDLRDFSEEEIYTAMAGSVEFVAAWMRKFKIRSGFISGKFNVYRAIEEAIFTEYEKSRGRKPVGTHDN